MNKKTGKIVVKHLHAALDVGLAVNPALVENQMEGSSIQGASRALIEEVKFNKTRVTNIDWVDVSDAALQGRAERRRSRSCSGRTSRRPAAGEPALAPVAAAVANAFFDATGVRIRTAPMTPARVRAALAGEGVGRSTMSGAGACGPPLR